MSLNRKKILLLSTGDSIGGAYELMYRMAVALSHECKTISFAVKQRRMTDTFIQQINIPSHQRSIFARIINSIRWRLGVNKKDLADIAKKEYVFFYDETEFSSHITADDLLSQIGFSPDVVLVGLTTGFISTKEINRIHELCNAEIIYIMMDVFPVTGGCHVLCNCELYRYSCHNCPAVSSTKYNNIPHLQLQQKKESYQIMHPAIMLGSGMTKRILDNSVVASDFRPIHFYSFAPKDIFSNKDRDYAKQIWNIPNNKKVLFAGADNVKDPRKGRNTLIEALKILHEKSTINPNDILILMAGNHNQMDSKTRQIPYELKLIDYIRDMRLLALLYQAADVYIMSSIEDCGPMMIAESMMCGTPVIGTMTGYLETDDIIKTGINGYRVPINDANAMAISIAQLLSLSHDKYQEMSNQARYTAMQMLSDDAFVNTMKQYFNK